MKKPAIVNLTTAERQDLISGIEASTINPAEKTIVVEALNFYNFLLEELRSSKISINRLKQLLGFRSEQLKKYYRMH